MPSMPFRGFHGPARFGQFGGPAPSRPSYGYPGTRLVEIAPVLAPAIGNVTVSEFSLDGNTLRAVIDVDGQRYEGSVDLAQLAEAVKERVAAYHAELHRLMSQPSGDVSADASRAVAATNAAQSDSQAAVTAAGVVLLGSLVDKHRARHDALCAGWWGDVTHAVSSAASSVEHAVTHTMKTLKGPIQIAAGAAATAVAGPLAGPLAAQLSGTLIDAAAGDASAKHVISKAQQMALSNPTVAKALAAATTATAKATAAYHVADTVAQAAGGNVDAGQQIQELLMSAAAGDPGATSAIELARAATGFLQNQASAPAQAPAAVVASGIATNLRHEATHAASRSEGQIIGYVRPHDGNPPQVRSFRSVDDADDWYGQWLGLPYAFSYVAYYDKNDPSWPRPLNEQFGKTPPHDLANDAAMSGWIVPLLTGAAGFAAGFYQPEIAKLGRTVWNRARGAAHATTAPVAPPPPQA